MTRQCLLMILISHVFACLAWAAPPAFEDDFFDKTLRIDFFQTGNANQTITAVDQVYEEGRWAGNPRALIDSLNRGAYSVKIVDINTNRVIYSRGFSTIFEEYQTTEPAKLGVTKTFHESLLIPAPRRPFLFILEARDKLNLFAPTFKVRIDPADVNIIREHINPNDRIVTTLHHGDPHEKVDFVFLAEGYTEDEWDKFKRDVTRFTDALFRVEPFKSERSKFNVSGVFRPSAESGVDEPTKGAFKNTVLSASYNALDTPRYLLIDDNRTMRDIARAVPYDTILVLANTARYGGGGIYNNYTIFTADDRQSEEIMVHEFGHGFANLADEYFGNVAYTDYFPAGVEPYPPNITALLDPNHVKWQHLLTPGIPIPTPWGQEELASLRQRLDTARTDHNVRINALKKTNASLQDIEMLEAQHRTATTALRTEMRDIQDKYAALYRGKIGVFEGAGYTPKGLYRSEIHIGMFYQGQFGPVSEEAIQDVINHLTR
ncbi:MAG: IgA Peptidase M64 [Phycisphaerae bacterium]|nr:IgA Peptidase M64 [Phycisphaerae bacterium]